VIRLLVLTACLIASPVLAETWSGVPRIIDGDTLPIDGTRLRLIGIDAFEIEQPCRRDGLLYACGVEAAYALADLVGGRTTTCIGAKRDRNGQPLVVCIVDGVDLGRSMVSLGWALPEFGNQYELDRDAARASRAGVWAGTFVPPGEWRLRSQR